MTKPKETSIIWPDWKVRAALAGNVTEFRVPVTPPPPPGFTPCGKLHSRLESGRQGEWTCWFDPEMSSATRESRRCPFGTPGDRVVVKEAWTHVPRTAYAMSTGVQQVADPMDPDMVAVYRADWVRCAPGHWRPAQHMPRRASRLAFPLTDVRVEELQGISEADAKAEGVVAVISKKTNGWEPYALEFSLHWDERYAKSGRGWGTNPWVWVAQLQYTIATMRKLAEPKGNDDA